MLDRFGNTPLLRAMLAGSGAFFILKMVQSGFMNLLKPLRISHRNPRIDLHYRLVGWFLYDKYCGFQWVNATSFKIVFQAFEGVNKEVF